MENDPILRPIRWEPALNYDLPLDTPRPDAYALVQVRNSVEFDDLGMVPLYNVCPPNSDGQQHVNTACHTCLPVWNADYVLVGAVGDALFLSDHA